jgi:hypothetical protein
MSGSWSVRAVHVVPPSLEVQMPPPAVPATISPACVPDGRTVSAVMRPVLAPP